MIYVLYNSLKLKKIEITVSIKQIALLNISRPHQISWSPKKQEGWPRGNYQEVILPAFILPFELKLKQPFWVSSVLLYEVQLHPLALLVLQPLDLTGLYCWLFWVHNLETPLIRRFAIIRNHMGQFFIINLFLYLCILHYFCFSREPWPTKPSKKMKQEWITKNSR